MIYRFSMPLNVLPMPMLRWASKRLIGLGTQFGKIFPVSDADMRRASIPVSSKEYATMSLVIIAFYFVFFFLVFYTISYRVFGTLNPVLPVVVSAVFGILVMVQLVAYPVIQIKKKVRDLDRNLVFALRTLLVQLRSGVSLFDSMKVVAEGNYGAVSTEFHKAVEQINTGTIQEAALERIAENNPSIYFRRTIWQVVNGMRAGADITQVLAESVDSLTDAQSIQIRNYESQMKILSLVYMMLGVIVPALGITFLIVLSSFPQITITDVYFWVLLTFVGIGQFMYMGIVKSKRPSLLGD
ncbi:MAG: type II secretion system F family protein [Candidatus Iainarchaeum archaeon]|uniref:Type II secretion system F family protein n=1 Tax=Candidatus Iainarchaeum sp. TaxID=3101447 RepID=A0A7T9DK65_9ARCH|nr:MAG: type II secretion system F family protein [Candidatus Diapherotrites archaeon]